ncbi:type II toxin-antitoxin system HicB family antitoxin [Nostoc sp. FACHB-973]|nr:type II toxin-antitoxin system HicB family antitoxin [Nostoc sp. FACHB-973]
MKFIITIFQDEDGMFLAECPSITGCVSQGKTEQKAEENIQEAIKECLEVRVEKGDCNESDNYWKVFHY